MTKSTRTFGLELEFANVQKSKVILPPGYSWSANERSIVNTDLRKSLPTGDFGGELNTRPLTRSSSDLKELKAVIGNCFDSGGVIAWNTGFDGHLYIGDKSLEEIKRIFLLGYKTAGLLNKMFDIAPWFNEPHLCPLPSSEINDKVQRCDNFTSLKGALSNSSNRGHYRFLINVMSFFTTKTLEFRLFNGTKEWQETKRTIDFMYSFLDFAITQPDEVFDQLDSVAKMEQAFDVKGSLPQRTAPFIFAETHTNASRNIARAFPVSKVITAQVIRLTKEEISIINPFHTFDLELSLYGTKKLHIYSNSEYNLALYLIATGNLELSYSDHFEVLNSYQDGTTENQLSLFLIFCKIQKYSIDQEYGRKQIESYLAMIPQSIEKIAPTAQRMIEMFENSTFTNGSIVEACKENRDIVYQQEKYSKTSTIVNSLSKYTNYVSTWEKEYYYHHDLQHRGRLVVLSQNNFLPYYKAAKSGQTIIYSSDEVSSKLKTSDRKDQMVAINTPPDDYEITPDTKITIAKLPTSIFVGLQRQYVKKIVSFKTPVTSFVFIADGYVLGAAGFDWAKVKEEEDLFLLSDFCTNNNVYRLSKLILYLIKTKELKQLVERISTISVELAYTYVYTNSPVSMKYRGAFKKIPSPNPNALKYLIKFGSIGTIQDALIKYQNLKQ